VLAAGLVAAPGADAAVSCSYVDGLPVGAGNNSAAVTLSAAGDQARIGTAGDPAELRVNGAACSLTTFAGTRARLDNLDAIRVTDTSSGNTAVIVEGPVGFVPGESPEGDSTPEIEFEIDLGAGAGDAIGTLSTTADDRVRLGVADGAGGADFNAGSGVTNEDPDYRLEGIEVGFLGAGGGSDQFSAAGGRGFSAGLPWPVALYGQDEKDSLVGGAAADYLHGGTGNDLLVGGPAADSLDGAEGDQDYIDLGADPAAEASLLDGTATGPAGTDTLANVEGIIGTSGGDRLEGDANALNIFDGGRGPDRFRGKGGRDVILGYNGADSAVGGRGADVIAGENGADSLTGGRGQDIIYSADGNRDEVNCGNARDGYLADRFDDVAGCEIKLEPASKAGYKLAPAEMGSSFEPLGLERGAAPDHLSLRLRLG
jgi:Ca2+-binding RTX toxin-like protein